MEKSSSFRDKVVDQVKNSKSSGRSYGYLLIPKGVELLKIEEELRVDLDFIPYRVTDENHPDRKDEKKRALPGSLWYRRPFMIHRAIGINEDAFVCPRSIGKPCPICKHRSKRRKEGADKDELKAMNASDRNLYVVKPIGSKDFDEKLHLFDISDFGFQQTLTNDIKEDEDRAIFAHLEKGLTLRCRFTNEKVGKNDFYKCTRIDYLDREEPYDESIVDKAPNLDEVLVILSYEKLEAAFFEEEGSRSEDDDDEPRRKRHSDDDDEEEHPNHHRPKRDEEEDDEPRRRKRDDDDEEERPKKKHRDDDEEEDEKPKRKPRDEEDDEPPRKHKRDRDDEEDEEPRRKKRSDDDEDEKPKKRRDADDDEEPARKKKSRDDDEEESPKRKKDDDDSSSSKCPAGHRFGKDCDKFPKDCDKCKKWDACYDHS